MRKITVVLVLVWAVFAAYFVLHVPEKPSHITITKVVALEDLDDRGKRLVTVEFEDGSRQAIETYAPFFYKVGDKAYVAVHTRYLLPDVHKLVSSSEIH